MDMDDVLTAKTIARRTDRGHDAHDEHHGTKYRHHDSASILEIAEHVSFQDRTFKSLWQDQADLAAQMRAVDIPKD
jgi:hypothetical protein